MAVSLGAGRVVADEPVDATAGVLFHRKVGDAIIEGDIVATIYCNRSKEVLEKASAHMEGAIEYSTTQVKVPAIITHKVTSCGVGEFTMPEVFQK